VIHRFWSRGWSDLFIIIKLLDCGSKLVLCFCLLDIFLSKHVRPWTALLDRPAQTKTPLKISPTFTIRLDWCLPRGIMCCGAANSGFMGCIWGAVGLMSASPLPWVMAATNDIVSSRLVASGTLREPVSEMLHRRWYARYMEMKTKFTETAISWSHVFTPKGRKLLHCVSLYYWQLILKPDLEITSYCLSWASMKWLSIGMQSYQPWLGAITLSHARTDDGTTSGQQKIVEL